MGEIISYSTHSWHDPIMPLKVKKFQFKAFFDTNFMMISYSCYLIGFVIINLIKNIFADVLLNTWNLFVMFMFTLIWLINNIRVFRFDQEQLLHKLKWKTILWNIDQEETKESSTSLVEAADISNEIQKAISYSQIVNNLSRMI